MDALLEHLTQANLLTWRDLLRVGAVSGGFMLLALFTFPLNAASRRVLLVAGMLCTLLLPLILFVGDWRWQLPLSNPPLLSMSTGLPNLLVWGWLAVALPLLLRVLFITLGELQSLRRAPFCTNPRLLAELQKLSSALQIPVPELRTGPKACATTLGGSLVQLPSAACGWTDAQLRAVLAHELVHVRRRDDRWLLVCAAGSALYWWLPWMPRMYRACVQGTEESCDDVAAELLGSKQGYATVLADMAKAANAVQQPEVTSLGSTAIDAHPLVQRIGRFACAQMLQTDTAKLFWCMTGLMLLVGLASSVQFVARAAPPANLLSTTINLSGGALEKDPAPVPVRPAAYAGSAFAAPTAPHQPVLAIAEGATLLVSGGERQLLEDAQAIYPGRALNAGLEGDVVVDFEVARDGTVRHPVVVASYPEGIFDRSALTATRDMRFSTDYHNDSCPPGRSSCITPPVRVQRWFRYRLKPLL